MVNYTEMIYSNDYADYILPYSASDSITDSTLYGAQMLDSHYLLLHDNRISPSPDFSSSYELYDLSLFMPNLYHPLSTVSLEVSGITRVQTQPLLNLSGKGTLIGFLDSGIDYTHPAFIDAYGNTRIETIWDQTYNESESSYFIPNPYYYGKIYFQNEINNALHSDNPLSYVPVTDSTGHGSSIAGIAAGSPNPTDEFTGVSYESGICVVKLKPAKKYLRDYHFASPNAILYQENDIMMGIRFLTNYAQKVKKPMVICISLGTNQGDHGGNSPLSKMISNSSYDTNTIFSIGTGNEGNKSHHYSHCFANIYENDLYTISEYSSEDNSIDSVEVIIPENCSGFTAQLWSSVNAVFSVGFESPIGTQIAPISTAAGKRDLISLPLEKTEIELSYSIAAESGASQFIAFRFTNPLPGNWIIRVYNQMLSGSSFHIWLPASGILTKDVKFLKPDPNTTLTVPSDAQNGISTGFYDGYTGGIVSETGRGFTRYNQTKPELISPGMNLTAPLYNTSSYRSFSGSSGAAALLAGAISLLQQRQTDSSLPFYIDAASAKAYFIRGAERSTNNIYPNPVSGYGTLNLYNIFLNLIS